MDVPLNLARVYKAIDKAGSVGGIGLDRIKRKQAPCRLRTCEASRPSDGGALS
ncbi:hypothetical protein GCM10011410_28990 [Hoyosella rhizosphaerae]|uniref:Uncharacterized protein n=1 Tax=Hoyosella rhizosphaerae TaxID=1755582 RepID=A0A916UIU4_9ACTN|nr:hypothetical protein GCM10011410_28990 [Hoyosella rhizosphaerae]